MRNWWDKSGKNEFFTESCHSQYTLCFSILLIDGCGFLVGVVCVFSGNGRFRTREGMRNRKFIWSGLISLSSVHPKY